MNNNDAVCPVPTLHLFFFLLGLAVAGLVLVAAPSNHLSRDLPYPLLFSAAFAFGGAQFTPNPSAKNFATCDYECLKWNSAGVCTNIDDEGRSQVDCGKTAKPGGINLDIGIVIFSMIFMKASNLGVDAIMKRAGQRPNKCWGCFSLAFLCTFPAPIPHSYSDMVCLPSPRLRVSLQYQPSCEAARIAQLLVTRTMHPPMCFSQHLLPLYFTDGYALAALVLSIIFDQTVMNNATERDPLDNALHFSMIMSILVSGKVSGALQP